MARLLICAGGTGGGVYPALTVLQALGSKIGPVLWVGGEGGMEASLVQRAGVPFKAIPAAGLHGVGLRALPGNLLRVARGLGASRRILQEFRPDVLFFTGGYVAGPMALASWKIPSLVYVPDIEPGLALKGLIYFARCVAATAADTQAYLPAGKRMVVTGYPTRASFAGWTREKAREYFDLADQRPVLLVFGGSKGARSINRAVLAGLPTLLQTAHVVHISGELDWPEVQAARLQLTPEQAAGYRAYPYLHEEIGAAFASADLAICRAGASTLGELPVFGLPALLVPYPHAWRYQKVNAAYLVDRGAARLLPDEQLAAHLIPSVQSLLADPAALAAMRANMQALARPDSAAAIGRLILELAGEGALD